MWVRGLKRFLATLFNFITASHPMWVRGLKQQRDVWQDFDSPVAPHVGAWIETIKHKDVVMSYKSRTPCGCVD